MGQDLGPFLMLMSVFATVAWIVQAVGRERTRQMAQRVEMQAKLLDRAGSVQEFGKFLESPAGQQMMQTLAETHPRYKAYATARTGVLMTLIAAVILWAAMLKAFGSQDENMRVVGILTLAAGIAFLASPPISRFIARRMGIPVPPDEALPPRA
jgi:hypothetical protein